jgi:hypothetical protein
MFRQLPASQTGIDFNNVVIENDSVNPLDLEFLYNGGGVAVGDFNNDSLPDLYFTASTTSNKLYLNKGDLKFDDITVQCQTTGEGRWANGAAVVDINADGLDDIYVCNTIKRDPARRANLLYINQGIKNGIPVFKEMAGAYGIADAGYSVQSAFFDYDNDGDLDMYLVQTKMSSRNASTFAGSNYGDTTSIDKDKLFRNDWSDSLEHPIFTDISKQAGVIHKGYGLGIAIADLNKDGWKDIYVSNDFYSNDHLYINNHDGTFSNTARKSFRHFSMNAMGTDIADINNDGLADVLTVDMNPEDNYRKKKNMNGNNYNIYQQMLGNNYSLQYVRNTLQVGAGILETDSINIPVFSDLGYLAGVAETDWSWSPAMEDMDNDGLRDILITNGYPRDVTDHDFIVFRANNEPYLRKTDIAKQIPQIKISNYAYHNKGNMQFTKVSDEWGLGKPSFSNGAVATDLDRDGDLDYVVNNINDPAFVYENTSKGYGYLNILFKGDAHNPKGIGAIATIYYGNTLQTAENSPYRGYLSSLPPSVHFGLGKTTLIDSVVIEWSSDRVQVLTNVQANHDLTVDIKNAGIRPPSAISSGKYFERSHELLYLHREYDFIDFDFQRLLPHKFSEYGPCMEAKDLNGDSLDDLVIGGNAHFPAAVFLQVKNGTFQRRDLPAGSVDNAGLALFDADGDKDIDIYFSSGGAERPQNDTAYRDKLFINDGKANFTLINTAAVANDLSSKSCVRTADVDRDGDLDLFIGGRVVPGRYPQPLQSRVLRNDSKNGVPSFADITTEAAPVLNNIGMICDAQWTDINTDGWPDLILAGEWMPIRILQNNKGKFSEITPQNITDNKGLWTAVHTADLDKDGDQDILAGNLGLNSYYRGDHERPVRIYYGDFAGTQGHVAVPSLYLLDEKGTKREFTAHTRDDIVDPLPGLKKQYLSYKAFASADLKEILGENNIKNARVLEADYMSSAWIENMGNGQFEMHALPVMAQAAPLYDFVTEDINKDGNTDIIAVGNDWGTEPAVGRYDALNGLVLFGDGKGNFLNQPFNTTGFYVPGNARAIVKLTINGRPHLAAAQNRDSLLLFRYRF